MSRTYAIAMTRPHQRFGFKEHISKQLPKGALAWALPVMAVWMALAGIYVSQVTHAAPRADSLQVLERQITSLERDIIALEDSVARQSSMFALTERAKTLGFVEMQNPQYINPASHAFVRR